MALALLLVGCAGPQIVTETGYILELETEDLGAIPQQDLIRRIDADALALRHVAEGMAGLEETARKTNTALEARPGRYTQAENDGIRSLMLGYLSYRTELFRIVAFHSSYASIPDEILRVKSFLLAYTAGMTLYARGISVVDLFKDSPRARAKLNEPEPVWGIPSGVFDTVHDNVTHRGNIKILVESRERYDGLRPLAARLGILTEGPLAWAPEALDRHWATVEGLAPSMWESSWDKLARDASESGYSLWHDIQAFLSALAGDTRVSMAPPRVSKRTVRELGAKLRPGDILVARHNYYVSNAFLPGFWPHALLYVGSAEELEKRGTADRPWVAKHLEAYKRSASDGNPYRVIEAISEGVVFSSLEHAAGADYVAAFRPRVSEARKDAAIEQAFSHRGKPYDFEFDFFSTDELVCTELVYRAYDAPIAEERIEFELVRMLGRDTYPAIEMVRKFEREWKRDQDREEQGLPPERQLDFVAYLDGDKWRSPEELMVTTHIPAVPDRRGWTAGMGLGGGGASPSGLPLGDDASGAYALSLRLGHSLGWRWLALYHLEAAAARESGETFWHLGHHAALQWHPSRAAFAELGLGVGHALEDGPLGDPGPSALIGLGYELFSGYTWAVDLRGVYTIRTDTALDHPLSTLTGTLGVQLY